MISIFKMCVGYKEVFVAVFLMLCTLGLKGQVIAVSPTKTQLIKNAKLGDVEALEHLLRNHRISDFDTTEDKVFISNMLLLKQRSHYVIYGQYFDLLNGEWGGQNPGRVEKIKEVTLCKKKFDLLAAVPYDFTSYASTVFVDYLILEQEYAKKMQDLRKTAAWALPNTIANYVSTPDWIDLSRTESDEEYQRASKNNEIVQEKRLSVLGHFSTFVGNALVAQELNEYYEKAQQQFLVNIKKTFPAQLAKVYTQEYQRHCNKLYATKQYDIWFEKEYLSISDPYFSSYRFAEYFDNNRPIDGYRLWMDSEYKDQGNMMSQIIYSGRLYALKLALKRGVSPDVLNSKGQSARQVLQSQGYGYVQTRMKNLIAEYDKDPESFVMKMPKRTVYQSLEKKEGETNFNDPNTPVMGYKIIKLTDGPRVTKDSITYIRANGRVFLGTFARNATVFGVDGFENYSIDSRFKHGALLYRIGNNDSWKPLGSRLSLIPEKSGILQFTVNDRDFKNNSRGFNVEILGRRRDKSKRPLPLKDKPEHLRSEKEVLEDAKEGRLLAFPKQKIQL